MAKAKCKICGTELDTKTAYKVTDKNGKNKYFCSIIEFEAEEERKKKVAEDKDRVYRLICDIMGVNEVLNTALWKEKLEWNKAFSDEFIAKYLEEKKEYLSSKYLAINSSENALFHSIFSFQSTVFKTSLTPIISHIKRYTLSLSAATFFLRSSSASNSEAEQ